MARPDPGNGARAPGRARDAGPGPVPGLACAVGVPTRMTCVTRTRAVGSSGHTPPGATTHRQRRDLMAKTKERTDKRAGGKHPGGRAGEQADRNGARAVGDPEHLVKL